MIIWLGKHEPRAFGYYMIADTEGRNWTLEGEKSALIINLGYNLGTVNYVISAQLPYLQSQDTYTAKNCQSSFNSC